MKNPLVYLAVPYTHKDRAIEEYRFIQANKKAGELMNKGEVVYSPITHCHPIHLMCDMPGDWKFWEHIDRTYLELCHKMYVLKLEGWNESNGVKAEVRIAKELKIPIVYLDDAKKIPLTKKDVIGI